MQIKSREGIPESLYYSNNVTYDEPITYESCNLFSALCKYNLKIKFFQRGQSVACWKKGRPLSREEWGEVKLVLV